MKKNIKLTEEQRRMVVKNAVKFKNEILTRITSDISQNYGGENVPFSKYTQVVIGWTKKS